MTEYGRRLTRILLLKMKSNRLKVSGTILEWAVRRAGKTIEAYCAENQDFKEWLDGSKFPTFRQAEDFARKLRIPFGYMFLDTPPQESMPIPFFRRQNSDLTDVNVRDLVLEVTDRQAWLSNYLSSIGAEKVPFVGSFQGISEEKILVNAIHDSLGLAKGWNQNSANVDDAVSTLVESMEDKGIVVAFSGVVGLNNNRPVDVADCRGFALVDDYAPFIFVNSKDSKTAQLFTLIHEFAHLLLGHSSGVGGRDTDIESSSLERLCDGLAASFLVPEQDFRSAWVRAVGDYSRLNKIFKVSRYVLSRRAKDLSLIGQTELDQLYSQWNNEPLVRRFGRGGQFYLTAIRRTGRVFLIHVTNALNQHRLQFSEAYGLVGMRGDSFHKLIASKAFLGY